jgi:hypothetical protein
MEEVDFVVDVVIRGLSVTAVDRIDADATARGLTRQEYLRRRFEAEGAVAALRGRRLTVEDLHRAATAAADIEDAAIMRTAWQ